MLYVSADYGRSDYVFESDVRDFTNVGELVYQATALGWRQQIFLINVRKKLIRVRMVLVVFL